MAAVGGGWRDQLGELQWWLSLPTVCKDASDSISVPGGEVPPDDAARAESGATIDGVGEGVPDRSLEAAVLAAFWLRAEGRAAAASRWISAVKRAGSVAQRGAGLPSFRQAPEEDDDTDANGGDSPVEEREEWRGILSAATLHTWLGDLIDAYAEDTNTGLGSSEADRDAASGGAASGPGAAGEGHDAFHRQIALSMACRTTGIHSKPDSAATESDACAGLVGLAGLALSSMSPAAFLLAAHAWTMGVASGMPGPDAVLAQVEGSDSAV